MHEILAGLEADNTQLKFNKTGLKTVLGSKANLHRLMICAITAIGSQCMGSSLITSYLPVILDQTGFSSTHDKTMINGFYFLLEYVVSLVAAFFIGRAPRRAFFLASTTGMLIVFTVWTALAAIYDRTKSESIGIGIVSMIFLFDVIYSSCWVSLVIVYPLEVVTTKQRGLFFCWTYIAMSGGAMAVSTP